MGIVNAVINREGCMLFERLLSTLHTSEPCFHLFDWIKIRLTHSRKPVWNESSCEYHSPPQYSPRSQPRFLVKFHPTLQKFQRVLYFGQRATWHSREQYTSSLHTHPLDFLKSKLLFSRYSICDLNQTNNFPWRASGIEPWGKNDNDISKIFHGTQLDCQKSDYLMRVHNRRQQISKQHIIRA